MEAPAVLVFQPTRARVLEARDGERIALLAQRVGHVEFARCVCILRISDECAIEPHVDCGRRAVERQRDALAGAQRLPHARIGVERPAVECHEIAVGHMWRLWLFMPVPRVLDVHVLRAHESLRLQAAGHVHIHISRVVETRRGERRRDVRGLPVLVRAFHRQPVEVRWHDPRAPYPIKRLPQRAGRAVDGHVVGVRGQPVDREDGRIDEPAHAWLVKPRTLPSGRGRHVAFPSGIRGRAARRVHVRGGIRLCHSCSSS